MQNNYPYDALMRFLYREMPASEAAEMARHIDSDPVLRAEYDELQEAKIQLPKDRFNPSTAVINNILQYSTKTALEAQF